MGYMTINGAASLHLRTLKILVYTESLEDLCLPFKRLFLAADTYSFLVLKR